MRFWRLVWKNVWSNAARATLTPGSIALVIVLFVVLRSLLSVLEAEDTSGATRIAVQHSTGLANFLPLQYRGRIEQLPGVLAVEPEVWFAGTYIDQRPQNFFGQLSADPQVWPQIYDDYVLPPGELEAWRAERDSFIAGRQLIDRFGWKVGGRIQITGSYIPVNLDLVLRGVYRAPDESNIFFHNLYLENSWLSKSGQTGMFYLRVGRRQDVGPVTARIDALFEHSARPVHAMPEKQFRLQFLEMLGDVRLLMRLIALTLFGSVVLVVANSMALNARERISEIAVIRALGFRPRDVLWLVLAESAALSLVGGAAGVLLSFPSASLLV